MRYLRNRETVTTGLPVTRMATNPAGSCDVREYDSPQSMARDYTRCRRLSMAAGGGSMRVGTVGEALGNSLHQASAAGRVGRLMRRMAGMAMA